MVLEVPWDVAAEVAFDVLPADEPGPGDWTALSTRLRATRPVRVSHGASRLAGGGEGTCQVQLNNRDRAIDPTNPAVALNVVPVRHARLQVTVDDDITYPLFRGLVDDWQPVWSQIDSEVSASLVDAQGWARLQQADLDLPRQMSHDRITALLDLAAWPAGLRDISPGVVEVEPLEQMGANLLQVLEDTTEAEGGDLYVAPDGKITFRSRHARLNLTPTVTFGDGGIIISGVEPVPWDLARLTNVGRFDFDDGSVYEYVDAASRDDFGPRYTSIRDLPLRRAEAEALAQWDVVRFARPRLWIDALQCQGRLDGVLDQVLGLRIGHAVQVAHTPPAGAPIDEVLVVERITHTFTNVSWLTAVDLSPDFGAGPWLTWDDPDLGWDSDTRWAP